MSRSSFALEKDEALAGMQPVLELFLRHASEYDAVFEDSSRLMDRGRTQALFVPAVNFVINAALNTLELPSVQERLPDNVRHRQMIANDLIAALTVMGLEGGALVAAYSTSPHFEDKKLSAVEMLDLSSKEYLFSLCAAPFTDVRVVGGGALGFMKKLGVMESPGEVVARSRELRTVANIQKKYSGDLQTSLGLPYAAEEHFRGIKSPGGWEIGFTPMINSLIKRFSVERSGCPALQIPTEGQDGARTNLLVDNWQRVVRYLLSPMAVIEEID